MATNFPSSFVEFHGTKVGGEEEEGAGEAALGTGGADETTIETAEGEGGGVGRQETVEDRHVTVEAGTMTVTVTTPVDTTAPPASAEDPLLQVVVGTLCHLTVMESIHPLRILMGGRMDLPPEGLVDMVLHLLEEVEGDMADPPDLHVLPELVYWSLPTLFHLKAHLKMVAMVAHDQMVAALLLREVALGWVPHLVKDTELAPHPLAPLPPEETWDMDDEVPHRIWVVLPRLIREMDIMGAHPLPVVSHVLFTLLVRIDH